MSTVSEYVCQDCGSLLIHSNPLTLESMKDVHKQLCIVARQKLIAAEAAKAATTKAAPTVQKPSIAAPASNALSPPPTIAAPAPPAGPSARSCQPVVVVVVRQYDHFPNRKWY